MRIKSSPGLLLCALACVVLPVLADTARDSIAAIDRGDFGPFTLSLNVTEHGYSVIDDPTSQAPTARTERFEVRSGDCQFNKGWSDCDTDRERSELRERGKLDTEGSSAWYGWYFHVPEDWRDLYPTKTVLGQFHQQDSHPLWMFLNKSGGLVLDEQTHGHSRRMYKLISKKHFTGRWHRIEVHARWKRNNKGFFRVWVNCRKKVDYRGKTMSADRVYFRYGVYRSFISRYKQKKVVTELPTQQALFAKVRKAKTRSGLHPGLKSCDSEHKR